MNNGCGDDDEVNLNQSSLQKLKIDCLYYDVDNLKKIVSTDKSYILSTIHSNIRSLPAKYDQLKILICDINAIGLSIDVIMICETFLTESNMNMYPIHGYQFICNINRLHGKGGGVALYIADRFNVTT